MTLGNILLYGLAAYGVYKIIDDKGVSLKDDEGLSGIKKTRKRKKTTEVSYSISASDKKKLALAKKEYDKAWRKHYDLQHMSAAEKERYEKRTGKDIYSAELAVVRAEDKYNELKNNIEKKIQSRYDKAYSKRDAVREKKLQKRIARYNKKK